MSAIVPRSPRAEASDFKEPHLVCEHFKIVIGDCFFEPDSNFTVPVKFLEAPLRTNRTSLGLQKAPRSTFTVCAATPGALSEISQGGLGDTLAGPELKSNFEPDRDRLDKSLKLCESSFYRPYSLIF